MSRAMLFLKSVDQILTLVLFPIYFFLIIFMTITTRFTGEGDSRGWGIIFSGLLLLPLLVFVLLASIRFSVSSSSFLALFSNAGFYLSILTSIGMIYLAWAMPEFPAESAITTQTAIFLALAILYIHSISFLYPLPTTWKWIVSLILAGFFLNYENTLQSNLDAHRVKEVQNEFGREYPLKKGRFIFSEFDAWVRKVKPVEIDVISRKLLIEFQSLNAFSDQHRLSQRYYLGIHGGFDTNVQDGSFFYVAGRAYVIRPSEDQSKFSINLKQVSPADFSQYLQAEFGTAYTTNDLEKSKDGNNSARRRGLYNFPDFALVAFYENARWWFIVESNSGQMEYQNLPISEHDLAVQEFSFKGARYKVTFSSDQWTVDRAD